ncbi:BREX-3 system P-loop-containing protein BrxF [Chloroflexota bacterium]
MKLDNLLEQNRSNHYKMLVVVDNNKQHEKIVSTLKSKGWGDCDITDNILRLLSDIPEEKRKLRIGTKIKEWFNSVPDHVILFNTNILYSPELGKLNPVGAFKYKARDKEIILIVEGHISGNKIIYSEYGRPDFTEMDVSELIHIRMEDIDD